MDMTAQEAIEKIIFIPRTFHLIRNESWNTLVQECQLTENAAFYFSPRVINEAV